MKVLVCGGRYYHDQDFLYMFMDDLHRKRPITLIVHGAATGADSWAAMWATERKVPQIAFPARWIEHGRAAGHIRNEKMLTTATPDLVLAFFGGQGTADMIRRAKKAKIPVIEPDKERMKENEKIQ